MKNFMEFVKSKDLEALKQLKVVKKLLEKAGYSVASYLEHDDDPYIFINIKNEDLSFGGIRIYKIGENLAYRIQNEKDTHPYGRAYGLNIEEIYNDKLSQVGDEKKAGQHVIETVTKELQSFFKKSANAEKDLNSRNSQGEEMGNGGTAIRNATKDYAASITTRYA